MKLFRRKQPVEVEARLIKLGSLNPEGYAGLRVDNCTGEQPDVLITNGVASETRGTAFAYCPKARVEAAFDLNGPAVGSCTEYCRFRRK